MKKLFLLSVISILSLISCQKQEENLVEGNGESLIMNTQTRASNQLDTGELIDVSELIDVYESTIYNVEYKLYDTPKQFLTTLTSRGNTVESITLFDDCRNGDRALGVYMYSSNTKNLTYNFYKDVQSFVENIPFETKKVNDILIDDIMYERDMKFPGCAVSVFYSDQWEQGSYNANYNDMRLEAALVPADEFVDAPAACGWTPNCLRTSGNQCRGHSCGTVSCGVTRLETNLVEREYPNYVYYVTEVVLEDDYYKLRDEFLNKSDLGKKYVRVFYQIQDHLMETMDTRMIGKILGVLPAVNRAIGNLLDNSYTGVIVDRGLKGKITDIIDASINNSTSDLYKSTLTQLQRDFDGIVDLNKADVYRYFDVK